MPAAALSPPHLDKVITKDQVKFTLKGHGDFHIGKERFQAWHNVMSPLGILIYASFKHCTSQIRLKSFILQTLINRLSLKPVLNKSKESRT